MLLRIHADERRNEPSQAICHAWHDHLVKHPHVVIEMPQREHRHANDRCAAGDRRNDQQGNVLDAFENLVRRLIRPLLRMLALDGFLNRSEGSREDQEAGKEQPYEEGGENAVQEGNIVHVEEHSDVARVSRVCPLDGFRGIRVVNAGMVLGVMIPEWHGEMCDTPRGAVVMISKNVKNIM